MQIKKFISLLTFSLFSAQTCLPMDAPTRDDGEFAHLKNQSQDGSQQITVIQKNDGQRKILTSLEEITAKMESDTRFTPAFIDLLIKCAPEDIKEFVNAVTFDSDVLLTEPKEIIFSGPSGIGKSELAKAIAYKLRFYYFGWSANTGDTYQNSASMNIEQQLKAIEQLNIPCVIIFDEIDFLTSRYENKQDSQRASVGSFWAALDAYRENKNFIFIMTTNNLYDIPDQVERRCAVFEIEKPNQKQRKKVIKFYLRKHQKSHSIDLDMATRNTDKLCTASIRRIIEKAITLANIKQESTITNELFEQALKKAKIIENMPWSRRIYKKIKPQSDGFHWLGLTVTGIGVAGGIVGLVYQIRTYGKTAESNEIAKINLEIAEQSLEVAKNSNWWQKAQTVTQWTAMAGGAAVGAGLFILKTLKQAES